MAAAKYRQAGTLVLSTHGLIEAGYFGTTTKYLLTIQTDSPSPTPVAERPGERSMVCHISDVWRVGSLSCGQMVSAAKADK